MSDVHPRDRVSYWHEVACKTFVRHEGRVAAPSNFDATLQLATLGDIGVVSIESRGLDAVERTRRTIAQGDDDVFLLVVQVRGSATLQQDGRQTVIHPGDFALLDAQRHYVCNYRDRKQITLKIPHRALKSRLASSTHLTAHPVRNSSALGALAFSYIRMLPQCIADLQGTARGRISEHVLDLTALALASEMGTDTPALSSGRAAMLLQLRTAIEGRLSDPTLGPSAAAAAAGISVRYANQLLAQQGTSLERLIIARRLEHCRRALEDPQQTHRGIGEIAFAWGFGAQSHFARRFKAVYGLSPRDYRRRFCD
jgi:AraC-like DNA-binding protein